MEKAKFLKKLLLDTDIRTIAIVAFCRAVSSEMEGLCSVAHPSILRRHSKVLLALKSRLRPTKRNCLFPVTGKRSPTLAFFFIYLQSARQHFLSPASKRLGELSVHPFEIAFHTITRKKIKELNATRHSCCLGNGTEPYLK